MAEPTKPDPAQPAQPAKPLSLSERIKALTAKAASIAPPAAAPGAPAPAAPPPAAKPAAPAPAPKPAPAPAPTAPAPAPAAPAARLSLSERLKALAAGKIPPTAAPAAPSVPVPVPVPGPAPAAAPKPAPAPAPAPKPAPAPAKPAAAAKEPTSALASDRIAQRLRGEKPKAPTRTALDAEVAAAQAEAEAAAARTHTPYVDDAIFEAVPEAVQQVILEASNEEGVVPVKRVLRTLDGPELASQEELVVGFVENIVSALSPRFFLDADEIDRSVFLEPTGDLSIRTGDGDVRVRGKCWEFFFVWRYRRPLGPKPMKTLQAMLEEVFTFKIANTGVCKMKVEEPIKFEGGGAHYFEASLELGGWCELRFEAATAFTDGRVLVATFAPRVIRSKDLPPPKVMSPKMFVELLNKNRRR